MAKGSKPTIGTIDTSGRTARERKASAGARQNLDDGASRAASPKQPDPEPRFRVAAVESDGDRMRARSAKSRIAEQTQNARHRPEFSAVAQGASSTPEREVSSSAPTVVLRRSGGVTSAVQTLASAGVYVGYVNVPHIKNVVDGGGRFGSTGTGAAKASSNYKNELKRDAGRAVDKTQEALMRSDLLGAQALAVGIMGARYGIKGVRAGVAVGRGAVNFAGGVVKAAPKVIAGIRHIPQNTARAAWAIASVPRNTVRTAQAASRATAAMVKSVGKGVYEVSTAVGRATLTVGRTAGMFKGGAIASRVGFAKALRLNAQTTGLSSTALAQRTVSGARAIRRFAASHFGTRYAAGQTFKTLGKGALQGAKGVGRFGLKAGLKGGKLGLRGADLALLSMGGANDETIAGMGKMYQAGKFGVKASCHTVKVAYKGGRRFVSGGIKTARKVKAGAAFIKNGGLRRLHQFNRARRISRFARAAKGGRAVAAAVQNVGRAVAAAVRALASNPVALVVIIVVCVAFGLVASVGGGGLNVVGAAFGGSFTVDHGGGDLEDEEFLAWSQDPTWGLPKLRGDFLDETVGYLNGKLKSSGGSYDYFRIYGQTSMYVVNEDAGGVTAADLSACVMDSQTMAKLIQPMYLAVYMQGDGSFTDAEAKDLLKELFDKIFVVTEETVTEWCNTSYTGVADKFVEYPVLSDCGFNHSLPDCPTAYHPGHASFTDAHCDWYSCGGHTVSWPPTGTPGTPDYVPGGSETTYCDGGESCTNRIFHCNGTPLYCGSHHVLKYFISSIGIFDLVREYFDEPIAALEASGADPLRLAELKSYREMALDMIWELSNTEGTGLGLPWTGSGSGVLGFPLNNFVVTTEWHVVDALHPTPPGHEGMDFAGMPLGTPVHAAADGTVTISQGDFGGYGNCVEIDHGGGIRTRYGHNMANNVNVGAAVKKGDVIAYAGSSGRSTGVHVHFEVWASGHTANPRDYLAPFGSTYP
jgi:hypothetical protein